jgi:hypothetical protein
MQKDTTVAGIPPILLKRLYVPHSLVNRGDGFSFQLRNPIAPGTLVGLSRVTVNGIERSLDGATIAIEGETRSAAEISHASPLAFQVGTSATVYVPGPLHAGQHTIEVTVNTQEIGTVTFPVTDTLS